MNDIKSQAPFETFWIIGTWRTNWTCTAIFVKTATISKNCSSTFLITRCQEGLVIIAERFSVGSAQPICIGISSILYDCGSKFSYVFYFHFSWGITWFLCALRKSSALLGLWKLKSFKSSWILPKMCCHWAINRVVFPYFLRSCDGLSVYNGGNIEL